MLKFLERFRSIPNMDTVPFWQERAQKYGRRSVLNIAHADEEFDVVTERQKAELFPYLKQFLNGTERVVVDFGCGVGRFTPDLARLIRGRAIGVDPTKHLLELAPKSQNVTYRTSLKGMSSESVDIVWIYGVLGGLVIPSQLSEAVSEMKRILRPYGLLFVVENTSRKKDAGYWKYRSVRQYRKMFPFAGLVHLHDMMDLHERFSVMAGRKKITSPRL